MQTENRAISCMNYLFLRAITEKANYPDEILEEIEFFLSGLSKDIDGDPRYFSYLLRHTLKDYVYQELYEGSFLETESGQLITLPDFKQKIKDFCLEHTDLTSSEINNICKYYSVIAEEVLEKIEADKERE